MQDIKTANQDLETVSICCLFGNMSLMEGNPLYHCRADILLTVWFACRVCSGCGGTAPEKEPGHILSPQLYQVSCDDCDSLEPLRTGMGIRSGTGLPCESVESLFKASHPDGGLKPYAG